MDVTETIKARPRGAATSADVAVATPTSLSHDGRGVARIEGKAVFIEGALPGDTVRFRYRQRRKRYDSGELLEILEPASGRVTPPCPHFGTCGGCDLQHLRVAQQRSAKQQILADQLERLGKVRPESWLAPITGSELGYRRRARLGVRQVESTGGVIVGFRQKNKSFLENLEVCLVLDPKVSRLLPALRTLIARLSCADRIPQIEVAVGANAAALVFRHLVPLTRRDRERLAVFGEAHDIRIYLQPERADSIRPLWPEEPEPLRYRLSEFNVDIRFEPSDFIQVNDRVNAAMVRQAIELLELTPQDTVLDLFCGLGNFSLPLARRAGWVVGVEGDEALIERAKANAQFNNITNVEFVVSDLNKKSSDDSWTRLSAGKLLLDPPRSGAMSAIKQLAMPLPSRIIYVSCYPATLARDSEYLVRVLGYRFAAAGVMDMFPHTSHLESMALFIKTE